MLVLIIKEILRGNVKIRRTTRLPSKNIGVTKFWRNLKRKTETSGWREHTKRGERERETDRQREREREREREGERGREMVKNPPANTGDMGSIPCPGRSHMPWPASSNY